MREIEFSGQNKKMEVTAEKKFQLNADIDVVWKVVKSRSGSAFGLIILWIRNMFDFSCRLFVSL